jgi:RNA polymerase sigma factor (sigma-70 family)
VSGGLRYAARGLRVDCVFSMCGRTAAPAWHGFAVRGDGMSDPTPSDQRKQAVAQLAGDLATRTYPRLRAIAWRSGAPRELVDDAVQLGLYSFIRAYPGNVGDVDGAYRYLARAVQTAAYKAARDERRHRRRADAAEAAGVDLGIDPVEAAIEHESTANRLELLANLTDEERSVAGLGAAGYSPAEIAEILGISKRRVRKVVTRANVKLRRLIEDEQGAREREAGL